MLCSIPETAYQVRCAKQHVKPEHPGLAKNIAPDGGPGSDITWIEIITILHPAIV